MSTKRVGIYVAHDDDAILGVGGRIVEHLKNGHEIYIVICADGRNSHKTVLGIETSPSPDEVKRIRKGEFKKATAVLGIPAENLFFLDLTDGEGGVWENEEKVKNQIITITNHKRPNVIYFHFPDAHPDHRAVSQIMLSTLNSFPWELKPFQFIIWTKELAKNRPEVDASQVPELPQDVIRINTSSSIDRKRKALFEMRSQVDVWPYPDWKIQEKPILDNNFLDYFLRGEEIFVKVERSNEN